MEKKFTKGEWIIDDIDILSEQGMAICQVYDASDSHILDQDMEVVSANTKLIAAAPDLLHRLNSIVLSVKAHPDYVNGQEGDEWHDIVELAEQTIKKATE